MCAVWVCLVGLVAVCWVGVLAVCWVGVGGVWPEPRKLELLLLLLERSVETRSLQDLVSHPRRWLSQSPKQNLLSSYLQRAAKLQRWVRVGVLCAVCLSCWSWVMLKDQEKRLPWVLSMRVVLR